MPMLWFGMPFSQGCTKEFRVPTPKDKNCEWCGEPIGETDSGAILQGLGLNDDVPPVEKVGVFTLALMKLTISYSYYHSECLFRMTMGSKGHQQGMCECVDDAHKDTSEEGMTKRQAAIASYQYFLVFHSTGSQSVN